METPDTPGFEFELFSVMPNAAERPLTACFPGTIVRAQLEPVLAPVGDFSVRWFVERGDGTLTSIEPRNLGADKLSAHFQVPPDWIDVAHLVAMVQGEVRVKGETKPFDVTVKRELVILNEPQGHSAFQPTSLFRGGRRTMNQIPHIPHIPIQLQPSQVACTQNMLLWAMIKNSSTKLSFNRYKRVMDAVLCGGCTTTPAQSGEGDLGDCGLLPEEYRCLQSRRALPFNDTDAYRCLKVATERFVQVNVRCWDAIDPDVFADELDRLKLESICIPRRRSNRGNQRFFEDYLEEAPRPEDSVADDNNRFKCRSIPYLAAVSGRMQEALKLPSQCTQNGRDGGGPCDDVCSYSACEDLLQEKLCRGLLIELIWSYWHEEGMLVQAMNAVGRRFQNMSRPNLPDPLANFEIDPLRPLNNLIWGYIQDEQHRLSVVRRAYEYDHHYGLRLEGKAVPALRPADSRSKFLEAFHNLLQITTAFYRQDDDTTVVSDAFPVLNALKDVHIILSQGAHNQFGDLPSTARQEMLIQQWLLARPEFAEYLPTRRMVRYKEDWMDRVDAMKSLQGWTDTSVIHFHNLADFGEQILLSVRFDDWNDYDEADFAKNWAKMWRPEIQGYTHAYRAVTGIDLSAANVGTRAIGERDLLPSFHIRRQLRRQPAAVASAPLAAGAFSSNGTKPKQQRALEPAIRRS